MSFLAEKPDMVAPRKVQQTEEFSYQDMLECQIVFYKPSIDCRTIAKQMIDVLDLVQIQHSLNIKFEVVNHQSRLTTSKGQVRDESKINNGSKNTKDTLRRHVSYSDFEMPIESIFGTKVRKSILPKDCGMKCQLDFARGTPQKNRLQVIGLTSNKVRQDDGD